MLVMLLDIPRKVKTVVKARWSPVLGDETPMILSKSSGSYYSVYTEKVMSIKSILKMLSIF